MILRLICFITAVDNGEGFHKLTEKDKAVIVLSEISKESSHPIKLIDGLQKYID